VLQLRQEESVMTPEELRKRFQSIDAAEQPKREAQEQATQARLAALTPLERTAYRVGVVVMALGYAVAYCVGGGLILLGLAYLWRATR
jgi:hypothetical protein